MNDDFTMHIDNQPGLIMEGVKLTEVHNAHGQHYWKATRKIGFIFGAEVEGELVGIGTSTETALVRLREEQDKLYESLWA